MLSTICRNIPFYVNMQRDASFDILKGMAIILVVVGHAIDDTCLLWRVITSVHMPLFFLVSGYFFHITPPCKMLYIRTLGGL